MTLYNGSVGRKRIIITVDPVIVKKRDILQRYVTSITNFAKTTAYKDFCNPRRGRGGGWGVALRISSGGDGQIGANIKTHKNP